MSAVRLDEYLEKSGCSQAAFGRRVGVNGVTQSAVAQWLAGGRIKAEQVLDVAAASGWRVTPHELRPDLYPHPEDGMPKTAALPLDMETGGAAIAEPAILK